MSGGTAEISCRGDNNKALTRRRQSQNSEFFPLLRFVVGVVTAENFDQLS